MPLAGLEMEPQHRRRPNQYFTSPGPASTPLLGHLLWLIIMPYSGLYQGDGSLGRAENRTAFLPGRQVINQTHASASHCVGRRSPSMSIFVRPSVPLSQAFSMESKGKDSAQSELICVCLFVCLPGPIVVVRYSPLFTEPLSLLEPPCVDHAELPEAIYITRKPASLLPLQVREGG